MHWAERECGSGQYVHGIGKSSLQQTIKTIWLTRLAQMIGIFTFALMVRYSMLTGWLDLIRDPRSIRFNKRYSGQKFIAARKRISGRSNKSAEKDREKAQFRNFEHPETLEQKPTFVLPDPEDGESWRVVGVPEAGDVSRRHETTNLFEESEGEDDGEGLEGDMIAKAKSRRDRRVKGDDESDLV